MPASAAGAGGVVDAGRRCRAWNQEIAPEEEAKEAIALGGADPAIQRPPARRRQADRGGGGPSAEGIAGSVTTCY